MKLVSIDIETTGLDAATDQIIQFAAVLDDWSLPRPLAVYSSFVRAERISGHVKAIAMHARRWQAIEYAGQPLERVMAEFGELLLQHDYRKRGMPHFVPAGKNYFAFDDRFLRPHFAAAGIRTLHRSLDPVLNFTRESDAEPPGLAECCARAGIGFETQHDALADALAVCRLLRAAKGLRHGFEMAAADVA